MVIKNRIAIKNFVSDFIGIFLHDLELERNSLLPFMNNCIIPLKSTDDEMTDDCR
jgi:hypothetical protein